ncbi:MAG: hypothetical protein HQK95_08320 [Nitrospirae bacterium]|nr:hypothetical protein [Nitrospirota bacterium]
MQKFPPFESQPDQLTVEPESGAAVSVTDVPELNEYEHVEPQLIPAGELVTVPVPVLEAFDTDRVYVGGCEPVNIAVTLLAVDIRTVHTLLFEPLVESQPDQLVNCELESGVAVRLTTVFAVYDAVPVVLPHDNVPESTLTVPEPVPDFMTVSVLYVGVDVNVAVTLLADDIATVHWLPLMESHPDQLVNVEPELGIGVSTTDVPDEYDADPVLPLHDNVPESAVTVPEPVPDFVIVRVYIAVNVAVTFLADDIATVHWLPLDESHPDQLVNVEPEVAAAVSTTDVPDVYDPVPVLPLHVIVPESAVIVPEPVPDLVTVSV